MDELNSMINLNDNDNLANKQNKININNNVFEKNIKLRIYYFDILRIISSFSVILIHISGEYYLNLNINDPNWKIAFYYNGIARVGLQIFFMISGALFLSKEITLNIIITKYIKRILIHLIIWSFIYSIYDIDLSNKININKIIIKFFNGHYHLWYLYSTIELYIISPFLREVIKKDLLKDFLKLSFIFTFIFQTLNDLNPYYPKIISEIVQIICKKLNLIKIKGNIFYFAFGYYIQKKKKIGLYNRILIYFLGLLGIIFTTIISYNICIIKQQKIDIFFNVSKLNILIYSFSVFVLLKENCNNLNRKFFKILSNYTFGIYLIHPLIIHNIRTEKDYFSFIILLFKIPLKSLIVFLLSLNSKFYHKVLLDNYKDF